MGFETRIGYFESPQGGYEQVLFPYETETGYIYRPGSKAVKSAKCAGVMMISPAVVAGKAARDALACLVHCFRCEGKAAAREGKKFIRNLPLVFTLPGAAAYGIVSPVKGQAMAADWMRWANCQENPEEFWSEVRYHNWQGPACFKTMWFPICFQPIDRLTKPFDGEGQPKEISSVVWKSIKSGLKSRGLGKLAGVNHTWTFTQVVTEPKKSLFRRQQPVQPPPAPVSVNLEWLCDAVIAEIGYLPGRPRLNGAELASRVRIAPDATLKEAVKTVYRTAIGDDAGMAQQSQLNHLARFNWCRPTTRMKLRANPNLPWRNVALGALVLLGACLLHHFRIISAKWALVPEILGGAGIAIGLGQRLFLYCAPPKIQKPA